jgi:hypothetical protein
MATSTTLAKRQQHSSKILFGFCKEQHAIPGVTAGSTRPAI